MATDRLVKVTNDKGEETIERVPEGTVDDLRKVGADVEDPKTGQKNQGRPVFEANFPEEGKADAINIAKEIAKVLKDALREHGDEMQGMFLKNMSTRGVTVKVTYKPDEQGEQTEDEFVFRWDNGSIRLDNVGQPVDLGQIQNRSGRSTIQKDLLKDKLSSYLASYDSEDAAPSDPAAMPDGQQVNEERPDEANHGDDYQDYETQSLWESEECQNAFCDAVKAYRADSKNKEAIKALLRAARPYGKGNTIQEKLKGAVDWYNWFTENPPKNTKKQVFLEDEGGFDLFDDVLKPLAGILDKLKKHINETENLHLGAYYQSLYNAAHNLHLYYSRTEQPESLDEEGWKNRLPEESWIDDDFDYSYGEDEVAVNEEDEFGPEVGDEVEYDGGHYKLYGYCGYEVVLQNVDDERDFKVVKPADAGIEKKKEQMQETDYVDPEQLPDDDEDPLANPEYVR